MIHFVTDENFPTMSARMEESYRRAGRTRFAWRARLAELFEEIDRCAAELRAEGGPSLSALIVLKMEEPGGSQRRRPAKSGRRRTAIASKTPTETRPRPAERKRARG